MARRAEEEARVGLRLIREARRVIERLGRERSAPETPRGVEEPIGDAGPGNSPTTDELIRAAASEDPFARAHAIGLLGGRAGAETTLLGALRDDYPQVRRAAIRSLVGSGDLTAIRAVIDVVDHDPSAEVRAEALEALEALVASMAAGSHRGEAGETG
jgi:HEAT repeat protein